MSQHRVSYTLDSTLETVNSAEQTASRMAADCGFDDDDVMKIAMAVREAAVNAVLHDTVRDILGKGNKRILLSLGEVNYIDSSGIGELVSAFTTVRNQGGELKLLNLTKKVHDLLQITKLYTVFDVKDDEAAAVKSFN